MPRVSHPDWLLKLQRQEDETSHQRTLETMFQKVWTAGSVAERGRGNRTFLPETGALFSERDAHVLRVMRGDFF